MPISRYVLQRAGTAVVTFLFITAATFAIIRTSPGDPIHAAGTADTPITPAAYASLRSQMHLDEPVIRGYLHWLAGVVQFDFGNSLHTGEPVRQRISQRVPATALPALAALAAAVVGAIAVGAWLAPRPGTWCDRLIGAATLGVYSVPRYVMGMLLIVVVGVRLGWLPFVGTGAGEGDTSIAQRGEGFARHGALLVVCLAYPLAAYLTRVVRDTVCESLASDYVRTARAKGASMARATWRHALPNCLLPLITLVGLMLPPLLGGTVILEVLFSWPGLGRLMYEAAAQRDYPVIMGLATFMAALVLGATLITDLVYTIVDPRTRPSA